MSPKPKRKTEAMIQYDNIKQKYEDTIVFFQLGDFYETFYNDAKIISKVLNITLTSRGMGIGNEKIPLAGVPVKSIDTHLKKLVTNGHKVVIVDQLEDARKIPSGRIVRRGVTRVVTPGTIYETSILDDETNNFLLSLVINERQKKIGISFVDVSTGEFLISEYDKNVLERFLGEFTRFNPKEIILPDTSTKGELQLAIEESIIFSSDIIVTKVNETLFNYDTAKESLMNHFEVKSLAGYGCDSMNEAVKAAGAVISHLKLLKTDFPSNLKNLKLINDQDFLVLDSNTQRNLEIISNAFDGRKEGSLLSIYSDIQTSMGSRLLRRWLLQPLLDNSLILNRLKTVESFVNHPNNREYITEYLGSISDFKRLISKIKYKSVNGRDLISLKNSIESSLAIQNYLIENIMRTDLLQRICNFDNTELREIVSIITESIRETPPIKITDGGVIKPSYNAELNELYDLKNNQKSILDELETTEQKRTLFNIKLGYNSVHGYYIEATKAQLRDAGESAVPKDYTRRQTLVNAERFITPQLKKIEEKILNVDERITQLEYTVFCEIRERISLKLISVDEFSDLLSELDVLLCFAITAVKNNFCQPQFCSEPIIELINGRHAVVEQIQKKVGFVPNSVAINEGELHIITGPNMSGKSTLVRQVALIVLMAQSGSWVPADSLKMGIIDKIFTRVGAFDRLTFGQSTFMLEMIETAHILHNATNRSLVILDEVGRGTSTFDGLSLAWAIAEHIVSNIKCKTLFATHYHQLSELENHFSGVKNFHLSAKERNGKLLLLYKLQEEATDHSFGISVAKMAGVPQSVILNAQKKLLKLETISDNNLTKTIRKEKKGGYRQLSLEEAFSQNIDQSKYESNYKELKFTVLAFLKNYTDIDVNYKTPIEALKQLEDLIENIKNLESKIQDNF
ncbi:MAG: DNA mismatch repair protein MutS [Candidatus Hodarchaeales archaeon]|jgi:DNA mismatch repair protein MutS